MSDLKQYQCPSCGGNLIFDIGKQKMSCVFCKNEYKSDDIKTVDEFAGKDKLDNEGWCSNDADKWRSDELKGKKVYSCDSCGGEIICDETTASSTCPYCDSKVVMTGQFAGGDKPDIIIPFKIDKKKAIEIFNQHVKNKGKDVPFAFRNQKRVSQIKGVYVPFWLFDAKASAQAKFTAAKIKRWSDSTHKYEEIERYILFREGKAAFENIPVISSSKLNNTLIESIEPFDSADVLDFDAMYLSGYAADKYDLNKDEVIENANQKLRMSMENILIEQTSEMFQQIYSDSCYIQIENGKSRYAFYPVWLLNIKWKNKKYQYAINGQTGKLAGGLPASVYLLALWWLLYLVGVSAVIYVITYIIMFLL